MLSAIRLPISALFIVLWPHPSHQAAASELSGKIYREAPMLTARVQRGELPPLEQRLPPEPMVVEPTDEVGQYGGTWHRMMKGSSDFHAYNRCGNGNMMDLQDEFGITYIIVSHDLGVLERICDRIAIMYLGRIVELAQSRTLFANPEHPYTRSLISAIPIADPRVQIDRQILEGDVPDPANAPPGCKFSGRCPLTEQRCIEAEPDLVDIGGGHLVRCHLVEPR